MTTDKKSLQPIKSSEYIRNKIYTIRDVQVMLDSDLAELYQIETGALNRQVKRNVERFPEDFCFQLSEKEFENLKCQIGISNTEHGGRRTLPWVFTEQGVSMLSGVIHTEVSIQANIKIMRSFVSMRHFIVDNAIVLQRLRDIDLKLLEHDEKIGQVLKQLEEPRKKKVVLFFKGQMFDATVCIENIINEAKSDIILIDGYVDTKTLELLCKKKKAVSVEIYTSTSGCKLTQKEIADFNSQYGTLTVNYTTEFHDRFMILDKTVLYHIGASIKDAGKKAFEISVIDDNKQTEEILSRL